MRETTLIELSDRIVREHVGLRTDSRRVRSGDIFVALPGSQVDGTRFIADALAAGASAVVGKEMPACGETDALFLRSDDPVRDLAALAQAAYGTDTLPFPVVGVTGTNGKTTVTYLLEHLFRANGRASGVVGTVSYRWPGYEEDAPLTTPDLLRLHDMLSGMRQGGVQGAFMEVSSHALDQRRAAGVPFAGAVFTNLTQDHLDYHKDMEEYFQAKARLFDLIGPNGVMAVNSDDVYGRRLLSMHPQAVGYGLREAEGLANALLRGRILSSSPTGLRLALSWQGQDWRIASPLIGAYNALNLMAVQVVGLGLGFSVQELDCFGDFYGVSGRLERIPAQRGGRDLHIFVDYAHTPDALVNVLTALRGVGFKRIVTVFGCGGDRDKSKRPRMGVAVASLSDVAVLTSDNPRHEEPLAIMNDVMPGLQGGPASLEIVTEPDRRKAIELALDMIRPGDALLIAGKGHERTQQIGDLKYPFSDQDVVRECVCA